MATPTCEFCQMQSSLAREGVIYQDDQVFVIPDQNPRAKFHFLIVPKTHIESVDSLSEADSELWIHLLLTAKKVARLLDLDVETYGYQLKANCGRHLTRKWPHLHLHLLADHDRSSTNPADYQD